MHASLRTLTLLTLALLLGALPLEARRKKAKDQPAAAPAEQVTKGLFTVTKSKSDWFFSIPDSLIGRELLVTVRYTATPGGTGEYGGELANQQTVYFTPAPGGENLLMRSRLLLNVADSTEAIDQAIRVSNADPIIASLKVESHAGGLYKVKVTGLFSEDNPALSLSQQAKQGFSLSALQPASSYIEGIKTFPTNTEVRTVKTWTAQRGSAAAFATGKVTIGLNVSFVLLPKVPMMRRLFDPRVGYFSGSFTRFSDTQQRVEPVRFIKRWRLEPKDSADAERMKRGELVEPKKPIVYYIDPATPKQWRPYLIQGVNDWQKAFEQAGFKNAIMAKELTPADSMISPEDARYSFIRYLASPIENAYGPHVSDPRSGEILESHICWYHNVMTLVHDWYMIQAGTLDEAARKMKYDPELMGQLIRFVSSHEVGHTLGLRHNFGSSSTVPVDSLRSRTFTARYGHTPSIMDYARFNYVAQPEDSISREGIFPRIGDYDCWAIKWGYTPMWKAYDDRSDHYELEQMTSETLKANRRLWFGDGETNTTNDPRCQTEDLGDDAMKASEYGILNLRRELRALPAWTFDSSDIYGTNLKEMYQAVVSQYLRYCNHVMRNIGGVMYDYKTVSQSGSVYSDTPRPKQERALDFLVKHVVKEPTWLIDQSYMSRITPSADDYMARIGSRLIASMLSSSLLDRLTPTYPADAYLPALLREIFPATGKALTSYDKALQRTAVGSLIAYFEGNPGGKARPIVLARLKSLQRRFHTLATDSHYAALADQIDRALVIK